MLYTGGVSFFALLAIFPALAILVSLYGLLADPAQAARAGQALSTLVPAAARSLLQNELIRLTHTPHGAMSAQSVLALLVGA